jgi:hypothetical protein
MRKSLLSLPVAVIAATAVFGASAGAKGTRTVKFTGTAVGGPISDTQSAFSYKDSVMGKGAGVQTTTLTQGGGTDVTTVYYGTAVSVSKDTFTIGPADANGIAPLTGSGHDTSGKGKLKSVRSTYTFAGTIDTKTLRFTVKLTGTYKLPR